MPIVLNEVDGTKIKAQHRLACHCGAVEMLLDLPGGIVDVRR